MKGILFFVLSVSVVDLALAADARPKSVIIISLDGVGFSQLRKLDPKFLQDHGVCMSTPPESSMTFPGHQTIATGKRFEMTDRQDVDCAKYENRFLCDNSGNRLLVKPMWTKFAEMGFNVKTYLWPNSAGPWHGIHHHKDKSYLPKELPRDHRADQVFEMAKINFQNWDGKKNSLFMGYSFGLDKVGHVTGPYSQKTKTRWTELREKIVKFQNSIAEIKKSGKDVEVIFVSDHGMTEIAGKNGVRGTHGLNPTSNPDMNGVFWTFPKSELPCPGGMENIASRVWKGLGFEWKVERFNGIGLAPSSKGSAGIE